MKLACVGGVRTGDVEVKVNVKDKDHDEDRRRLTSLEAWLTDGPLRRGLVEQGYRHWSPVQSQALPLAACGIDLIVEAKSGTGKTLVFAIPALQMIEMSAACQTLVLAPTREIAVQIANVLQSLGKYIKGLSIGVFIGGTDIQADVKHIEANKYHVVVGSPGRIKHFIKDNILNVNSVRLFVLDEADKLLEESFKADINYIFNKLPEHKQVIATSATYSDSLRALLLHYTKSPAHVKPDSSAVLLGISHHLALVDHHPHPAALNAHKLRMLVNILTRETFKQCLVFCNYQIRAQHVCKHLQRNGWPVTCLSGLQTQSERLETLQKLQHFDCRIVVATDLAARGLDAHNVDLVINVEIPRDIATYLHRIGRCGRYGSIGKGITIVSEQEKTTFHTFLSTINDECNIYTWNLSQNENISLISNILDTCKSDSDKTMKWKSFTSIIDSFNDDSMKNISTEMDKTDIFSEKNCSLNNYLIHIIGSSKIQESKKLAVLQINEDNIDTLDENMYIRKKRRKENHVSRKSVTKRDQIYTLTKDYQEWRTQLNSKTHQIQAFVYMFSLLNL